MDEIKLIIGFAIFFPLFIIGIVVFAPNAQEQAQADALAWAKQMHPSKDIGVICAKPPEASTVFNYRWLCRLRIDKDTSKILSCERGDGCRLVGKAD